MSSHTYKLIDRESIEQTLQVGFCGEYTGIAMARMLHLLHQTLDDAEKNSNPNIDQTFKDAVVHYELKAILGR